MRGTLAIDLGSSTTVVAWLPNGGAPSLLSLAPYALADAPLVPSLLWLPGLQSAGPLIGRQVLEAGLADSAAPQLHRDFKRRIGRAHAEGAGGGPATLLTPEQAGELLLRRLWRALPQGLEPERLVLTAPIDSYRSYRHWLLEACRELPVAELALVDEPTAAAIGAGLPPGSSVLVVDLGGGTVDLSLVTLQGGEGRAAPIAQLLRFAGRELERSGQALRTAQVVGKAGLAIGGRDIDRWIADRLVPDQPPGPGLLAAAERLKCELSSSHEAMAVWSGSGGGSRELRLSRQQLERLLEERGLITQLDLLLDQVLAAGRARGLRLADIAAVLPVGGASRMPLIHQWLKQRCPAVPIRGERPVEAVALGALALTPGLRVQDVLSHGVTLRCWDQRAGGHRWHPLFVPGQGWPTTNPLELVVAASRDGQAELELVLGEPLAEERAEVVFERGLPVLRQRPAGSPRVTPWRQQPAALPLDPPGVRGQDCLRLCFSISAAGELSLSAHDLRRDLPLPPRSLGPVR
jgi:molecular chaperone DnaK (HSP70)